MKYITRIFIFIFSFFCFLSCGSKESEVEVEFIEKLEISSLTDFTEDSQTKTLNINSNIRFFKKCIHSDQANHSSKVLMLIPSMWR